MVEEELSVNKISSFRRGETNHDSDHLVIFCDRNTPQSCHNEMTKRY